MSSKIEYGVDCSPAQLRKLKSGGAITLKPHQFSDSSPVKVALNPSTSRKIETAMRKMKGVRFALKPDENLMMGGATFAQRLARRTRNTFKPVEKAVVKSADVVKRGFNKTIVDSGVGKQIAKELIKVGTQYVLPAAGSALSVLAGDPTGMSGEIIGSVAGDQLQGLATRSGYGMVGGATYAQRQARRARNTFKPVAKAVKQIGKEVVKMGVKAAGTALTKYTGNPVAGKIFEKQAGKFADDAIDSGVASAVRKTGRNAKSIIKEVGAEMIDDYIDKNLTGKQRHIAEMALAGKFPEASDLVYDYASSEATRAVEGFAGYGIPRRTRGGLRMGKGLYVKSPAYSMAMDNMKSGNGMSTFKGRDITSAPELGLPIQTGSPYLRQTSPGMTPFIASSPQLAAPIRMGGMMMRSANKMGGSFLPAGTDRIGGSFLPAGN